LHTHVCPTNAIRHYPSGLNKNLLSLSRMRRLSWQSSGLHDAHFRQMRLIDWSNFSACAANPRLLSLDQTFDAGHGDHLP
jgi:hypothetical protein